MPRELTVQEKQVLSRIREQMAIAARELSDAIRMRRDAESQLRVVQHAMASPDGIVSSQQFVDDVARLRREIQIAIMREEEATTTRSRLSAEEFRALAIAAGQQREPAGLERTQRAGTSSPTEGMSRTTVALIKPGMETLQRAQAQYKRNSDARGKLEKRLMSSIKKTWLIVFLSALVVAALADILSILDLGWLLSWAIPMIVWFMVRRVTAINEGGDAIVAAHSSAARQLTLLQQRLRPAIQASNNKALLASQKISTLSFAGRSYVSTFLRDTFITQLIELIPILDWLPMYIGQVVKVFIDQNIAYQKVRKLMPQLRNVHQQIDRLEMFEIRDAARTLAVIIRMQQARESQAQSALSPDFAM